MVDLTQSFLLGIMDKINAACNDEMIMGEIIGDEGGIL